MPYNGAGVFQLLAPGSVTTGTVISSTWANSNFNDFSSAFSTCVLKDGTQTCTAPIPFFNGQVSAPGITFQETDTGLYRPGAGQIGVAASGTAAALFTSTGIQGKIGQTTPAAAAFTTATATTLSATTATITTANVTTLNAVTANITTLAVIGDSTFAGTTIAQNSQSAAYTVLAADANKHILHPVADNNPRTYTIPSNATCAFALGTVLTFVNEVNTVTIAITSDTMTLAGAATTGSRSLAASGIASALKIASTKWLISGTGLS